jgi:hypothetical protein
MSKRNVNDRSTYTFCKLSMQDFSHGKITLDNKSSYTEGKKIECPECKHKFIWDKFFTLKPRYSNRYYEERGEIPAFRVEMEINTPSFDGVGGDRLPRISYLIYGAKLLIEDRVCDSSPKDGVAFRSHNGQLAMNILEMK